jgi:hypothetical protein
MKAFLQVPPEPAGTYPAFEDLNIALHRHGVLHGILDDVLRAMVQSMACGKIIEVARGTTPVAGTPGRIEVLLDLSARGKPREREDGSVDHRDLQIMVNVRKGTALARRIPPTPGADGRTVFGKSVPVHPPGDVALPAGTGAAPSADDPDTLVATIDGVVLTDSRGHIEVRNEKIINQDIDYATGNVSFSGDLYVNGTVRAGFEVRADCNVVIRGEVENASVFSGRDLFVVGGALGSGTGRLRAGRTLKVRRMERFVAESDKELLVAEDALHCTLSAKESIRARTIVGGTASAGVSIEVDIAGTDAGASTTLHVGGVHALQARKSELLRTLMHTTNDMGTTKQSMYSLIKIGMDSTGAIAAEAEQELAVLKERTSVLKTALDRTQTQIAFIDAEIRTMPDTFIKAGVLHQGVTVKFGSVEKDIDEIRRNVCITFSDNEIKIGKK